MIELLVFLTKAPRIALLEFDNPVSIIRGSDRNMMSVLILRYLGYGEMQKVQND